MGCCNSVNSIEFGVALQESLRAKDADDFADVSLGSHSESNASMQQDTHTVYLNSQLVLPLSFLHKRRSITVPDPGVNTPTVLSTPKFGSFRSESDTSYTPVRSSKTSGASSFHMLS